MSFQVREVATRVDAIGEERAAWTRWNVHAETMRQLRAEHVFTTPEKQREAAEQIVATALGEGRGHLMVLPGVEGSDVPGSNRT